MSDKRFHIERDSTSTFTFFYDGKHRLYDEEVVNLLNEQTVEIQKLTKEKNRYKGQIKQKNDKIERLQRENNKLQVHYKYDVKHLKEENEQLEKGKMGALSLLGEEIDKNEQLQQELRGMDELLKSYRETIKHNTELLADATRNGYLPPLDDFVKG